MLLKIFSILTTIAGTLMSLSHFPQAFRILKRKSSKDISLLMYSMFTFGSCVWLGYGILTEDWPNIISFSFAVIGTFFVLGLTLKYR